MQYEITAKVVVDLTIRVEAESEEAAEDNAVDSVANWLNDHCGRSITNVDPEITSITRLND